MEVKKTTVNSNQISSTLDLSDELEGVKKSDREQILNDIGELLVERTLNYLADQKSPVNGYGKFKGLSKQYAEYKQEETGSSDANLDLTGSMVSSIDFKVEGNKVIIGVFGEDAGKADGHNNFSGSSKLPMRRFLPAEGETYATDIKDLISDSVRFAKADVASGLESALQDVETKADLYEALKESIGPFSQAKLREAALASNIRFLLEELDLLDLL
jgi:hypothetical protein